MRRVFAVSLFAALAGTLVVSFVLVPTASSTVASDASAERKSTFLIPASDGYGIAHCLLGASSCGQVVANAWCESHGYAAAASFGAAPREDFTGSFSAVRLAAADRNPPLAITCVD
jgi:hypothetical protein